MCLLGFAFPVAPLHCIHVEDYIVEAYVITQGLALVFFYILDCTEWRGSWSKATPPGLVAGMLGEPGHGPGAKPQMDA